MKIASYIAGLFLFFGSISFAQTTPFNFDFDYAQFGYDSASNYVEFYYSFNQNSLMVTKTDSANYLDGILQIVLIDTSKGDTTVEREWRITHQLTDSGDTANKSLVGVVSFIIPKGTYRAEITGLDFNNKASKKVISDYITIIPHLNPDNSTKLSDIQFASKIVQDSKNDGSIFYKNSMEVFPIPTSVFGENQPVLFYYSEVYHVKKDSGNTPLRLNILVYNSKKQIAINKNKVLSRAVESRVEVGSVPVNKLPTDTYTLVLTLIDSAANYGVSSSKRFFVYNPSVVQSDTLSSSGGDVLSSQFGVMSEEELDDLFDKSKYIATSYEIDQFEKIKTLEGKREYFFQFWKRRDSNLATPKNEYFNEYMERVSISNSRFGSLSKVGWKTDRGRVYMTYGEPSEIERFPNQTDSKPYEIWNYHEIEGGVQFVFADLTGFSDYTLLHSTMRGELRDENWINRVSSF